MRSAALTDLYRPVRRLGSGAFGEVIMATRLDSSRDAFMASGIRRPSADRVVAIKKLNRHYDISAFCRLREYVFYEGVPYHSNLVQIHDIFLDIDSMRFNIVMECMDLDLYHFLEYQNEPLPLCSVKMIAYQMLLGLSHMHAYNFVHRDIKPENVLIQILSNECLASGENIFSTHADTPYFCGPRYVVKLADFGLCLNLSVESSFTTYVATRWYRAPELLLDVRPYGCEVDIWSVASVVLETANLNFLFRGTDSVDQLALYVGKFGYPGANALGSEWDAFSQHLARKSRFKAEPPMCDYNWRDLVLNREHQSDDLLELVASCFQWDPSRRSSAQELLALNCFSSSPHTCCDYDNYISCDTPGYKSTINWSDDEPSLDSEESSANLSDGRDPFRTNTELFDFEVGNCENEGGDVNSCAEIDVTGSSYSTELDSAVSAGDLNYEARCSLVVRVTEDLDVHGGVDQWEHTFCNSISSVRSIEYYDFDCTEEDPLDNFKLDRLSLTDWHYP